MRVQEYGVWDKLLSGSDSPFITVNESVDEVRNLNSQLEGTALPRLNGEEIEKLIHRYGFEILGIK